MRLDELEALIEDEPGEAEAAIAELVSTSNVEQLAQIARSARSQKLALRAIEGLEDIGGTEATAALVELLEQVSAPFVVGGTEQKREHERRQDRLVQSVAKARGVPAPDARSQEAIAEFIESSRGD